MITKVNNPSLLLDVMFDMYRVLLIHYQRIGGYTFSYFFKAKSFNELKLKNKP